MRLRVLCLPVHLQSHNPTVSHPVTLAKVERIENCDCTERGSHAHQLPPFDGADTRLPTDTARDTLHMALLDCRHAHLHLAPYVTEPQPSLQNLITEEAKHCATRWPGFPSGT